MNFLADLQAERDRLMILLQDIDRLLSHYGATNPTQATATSTEPAKRRGRPPSTKGPEGRQPRSSKGGGLQDSIVDLLGKANGPMFIDQIRSALRKHIAGATYGGITGSLALLRKKGAVKSVGRGQ